jgi:riboflavin kinase / FMN adenylyltransferase
MRTVRDHQYVRPEDRGASAAIGNFDGVHRGHQAVIDLARTEARRRGVPLGVVTFEPHPREHFAPDAPPFRLMNAEAKAHRLEKLGVDILYELNFNKSLSGLAPEDFAEQVLAQGLGLAHVVVGEDFCFGRGRAGTATDLARFGRDMGFGVTVTPLIATGGVEVSSTRIRTALTDGRPRDAARCSATSTGSRAR